MQARWFATISIVASCASAVFGQQPRRLEKPVESSIVQCDQNVLNGRSIIVTSVSGVRAYVSMRGSVRKPENPEDTPQCRLVWYLHVAASAGSAFKVIEVDDREDDWYYENTFELLGWSRDGQLLLVNQTLAAGDWDEEVPILYDMTTGKLTRLDLNKAFDNEIIGNCMVYFRTRGFAQDGNLIIDAGPRDEDLSEGQKPCFPESRWRVRSGTPHKPVRTSLSQKFEAYGSPEHIK